ncbi:MAG: exosortase J [Terracidiphilus sp.]|jgi:exosortase J
MPEELELAPHTAEAKPDLASARPSAPSPLVWCVIAILAAAGCLGISHELALLWRCWTTDPLRSIGMLIPPASIALTLLVWRQYRWELRGAWWGMPVIALAWLISMLHASAEVFITARGALVSLIPLSLPVYLYASGVVLLFAGTHVWRKAWFPLGLLLLSQPVPILSSSMIDIPLQNISAHVARSFAALIHFAPTTPQLQLMFAPDFGMFIAPGCDGIRGAVAMGYVALVLGYVKRVSFRRWAAYVVGGVLLGYLFNFIRLCFLVVYYRIALGHPMLEGGAKRADYAIGSCLFLFAILAFLRLARIREKTPPAAPPPPANPKPAPHSRTLVTRCAAFALVLILVLALPSSPLRARQGVPPAPTSLADRMPKQIGEFTLTRDWYEQTAGKTLVEAGAYSAPGADEIILAVWVAPDVYFHDANSCWLARGLEPDRLATLPFVTAQGNTLNLSTGFYNDGVTDSIVVSVACTPGSCSEAQQAAPNGRIGIVVLKPGISSLTGSAEHAVPIMIRIDKLHSGAPESSTQSALITEAQRFLSGLKPMSLSQAFQ